MNSYYLAMIVFSTLMLLVLAVLVVRNNSLAKRVKRGFLTTSALILIAGCAECAGELMNGQDVSLRTAHSLVKFLELSIAPVIPVVCGAAVYPIKRKKLAAALLIAHAVLEFASIQHGIVFIVDENNVYRHCAFYEIYHAAFALGLAVMLVQVTRFCAHYQNQNKISLTLIMAFLLVGILWQVVNQNLKIAWMVVAMTDVLFYLYYNDLLEQLDPLTGLLNRRNYQNRLKHLTKSVYVMLADVNDFKAINDNFGHLCGDACLRSVGKAMKAVYGRHGLCYRIGGDEFGVILDARVDSVESLNEDFARTLEALCAGQVCIPKVALGCALFEPEKMGIGDAVELADQTMYLAKQRAKA